MAIWVADRLRGVLDEHELLVVQGREGPPESTSLLVTSRCVAPERRHGRYWVFSGLAKCGGRFAFGQREIAPNGAGEVELDGAIGQFTFVDVDRDCITAGHDLFGLGHLFASQHRDHCVVSNRLHLQLILLRALGSSTDLDPRATLALLFDRTIFFGQQNGFSEMLAGGVVQVPIDRGARLTRGKLELPAKRAFLSRLTAQPRRYDELIEEGVGDIIDNVRLVLERRDLDTIIVDLSGGKDSRMVLGGVMRIPGWRDRVVLQTKDVPGSRDVEIACGLANRFGGRFFTGFAIRPRPFTADENLRLWRSYFHGLYHRVAANPWTYGGTNNTAINFSGGGGEVYRAFWNEALPKKYLEPDDTPRSFAKRFVERAGRWDLVSRTHQKRLTRHLRRILAGLPGASLRDKLVAHYLYYRNRAHFGLRGLDIIQRHATWFPLMSGALLQASHSLLFHQRAAGRVVWDVTRRLDPTLVKIDYDGGPAFRDVVMTGAAPGSVSVDTNTNDWLAARAAVRAKEADVKRGQTPGMSWKDWPVFVADAAQRAYEETRAASSTVREILTDRYIDWMRAELAANQRKGLELASRLLAVRDSLLA